MTPGGHVLRQPKVVKQYIWVWRVSRVQRSTHPGIHGPHFCPEGKLELDPFGYVSFMVGCFPNIFPKGQLFDSLRFLLVWLSIFWLFDATFEHLRKNKNVSDNCLESRRFAGSPQGIHTFVWLLVWEMLPESQTVLCPFILFILFKCRRVFQRAELKKAHPVHFWSQC